MLVSLFILGPPLFSGSAIFLVFPGSILPLVHRNISPVFRGKLSCVDAVQLRENARSFGGICNMYVKEGVVPVPQSKTLRVLNVQLHVVPVVNIWPLVSRSIALASRFFASFVLPFVIVNLFFVSPLVATLLIVADNSWEQCSNAFWRTAIALSVHDILPCLDPRSLSNTWGGQTFLEG